VKVALATVLYAALFIVVFGYTLPYLLGLTC
jgi:hypothetical protein